VFAKNKVENFSIALTREKVCFSIREYLISSSDNFGSCKLQVVHCFDHHFAKE
jgi:hypothetical protein